jgi:hypothetical protein
MPRLPPPQSQFASRLGKCTGKCQVGTSIVHTDSVVLHMVFSRWRYRLNLTEDANFRLKNKSRGVKNDLPLGDGWAHWVPEGPYQEYIGKYGYQVEVCFPFLQSIMGMNVQTAKSMRFGTARRGSCKHEIFRRLYFHWCRRRLVRSSYTSAQERTQEFTKRRKVSSNSGQPFNPIRRLSRNPQIRQYGLHSFVLSDRNTNSTTSSLFLRHRVPMVS